VEDEVVGAAAEVAKSVFFYLFFSFAAFLQIAPQVPSVLSVIIISLQYTKQLLARPPFSGR
jgi:hypothetical protein